MVETSHNPNKYFSDELQMSRAEEVTKSRIETPAKLKHPDIKNLCSKFFVNMVYYPMALEGKREEALEKAAMVIVEHGQEIQDQLEKNDSLPEPNLNTQNPPAEMKDIAKISGHTISQVIEKITEILAGKSGKDLESAIANFGALFQVLGHPNLQEKLSDVVSNLTTNPLAAADVKDFLEQDKNPKASEIFNQALGHLNKVEVQAIENVALEDLTERRERNSETRQEERKISASR